MRFYLFLCSCAVVLAAVLGSYGCLDFGCRGNGPDEYDCGMNGYMRDCQCVPQTPAYGPVPTANPSSTGTSNGEPPSGPTADASTGNADASNQVDAGDAGTEAAVDTSDAGNDATDETDVFPE
jgi:hypothetical protein